jgi:hypothetical protein
MSAEATGASLVAIRNLVWFSFAAAALPVAPAHAAPKVALDSAVFVERAGSGNVRSLEPAGQLSRGDRVVTIVTWQRLDGEGSFTVTNPLPRSVYFQRSANADEEVSVDGGRSWGRIGMLRYGARLATPEDVTHVRWRVPAHQTAAGRGQIAYSGIVR